MLPQRPFRERLDRDWTDACRKCYALRAGNGTRTRDIQLGKLTLYQLSYSRNYYEYRDSSGFLNFGI